MIAPKSINKLIVIFAGAVGLLGTALTLRDQLVGAIEKLLMLDSLLLAAIAAVMSAALTFYIMNVLLFRELEKHKSILNDETKRHNAILDEEMKRHKATHDRLRTAEYNLRDSEKLKYADVVTGIPNESKWREDVKEIGRAVEIDKPFQNIFIDLDGFKNINSDYGYTTGDQIIRYFAQSIYDGMRRNEYIYKQPFAEMVGERVYRKYAGGDEFLFIVKGEEAHALGFLNALQKRINNEFNPYIAEMLGRPHLLSFHGAIWPMDTDDNGDSVLDHLHECLRIASQPGWESRVWYSGKNSAAIRNQAWVKNIYSEARGLFAKTG